MKTCGIVCAAVVAALSTSCWAQQKGFYGLRDYLTASSITDDGRVFVWRGGFPQYEALWTPSGTTPLTLGVSSSGYVSANGQYVGFTAAGADSSYRHQFSTNSTTRLPLPPGGFNTRVAGISGDGGVIAGFDSTTTTAWRWTPQTGTQQLATPAGQYAEPQDVSHDGQVIVGSSGPSGMIARVSQPVQIVPTMLPGHNTVFNSISRDNGTLIGGARIGGGSDNTGPAFKWTASGGFVNLGSIGFLPGTNSQHYAATAMNLEASIIAGTQGGRRAWIWDQQTGMRDLKSVLQGQYGLDVTNWTLERVHDISPDGRILAGDGAYFNGTGMEFRAWVAIIPSPGSMVALGTGAIILARRRRREA
jgi:uncharacterized membrane protein